LGGNGNVSGPQLESAVAAAGPSSQPDSHSRNGSLSSPSPPPSRPAAEYPNGSYAASTSSNGNGNGVSSSNGHSNGAHNGGSSSNGTTTTTSTTSNGTYNGASTSNGTPGPASPDMLNTMDEDLMVEGHIPVRTGTPGVWTDDVPSVRAAMAAQQGTRSPVASKSMVEEEDRPEALADVENVSVAPGMVRGTAQSVGGSTGGATEAVQQRLSSTSAEGATDLLSDKGPVLGLGEAGRRKGGRQAHRG
jgi:hypothetical protein